MARNPPKRRLLSMLRRTARSAEITSASRNAAEENALWTTHERALNAVREASTAAQRLSSAVAKQRGAVDAASDRTRAASVRAQDLVASLARISDAFDRLGIVALNAGLEGARLGENVGRALLLVSDEVRAQAARGGETARDVSLALGGVTGELVQLQASIDGTREASADLGHDAARATSAASDAENALLEIQEWLRKASGSDPEIVRAMAETAANARALVASLQALNGRIPRALLLGALRPVLDPLARLLGDDDVRSEDDEAGG
jgi:methyl-accepting chemotaxis protein